MTLRNPFSVLLIGFAIALPSSAQTHYEQGLKPEELKSIINLLPETPIYNLRFVREEDTVRLSAGFLTQAGRGWQITVVSPVGVSDYRVTWNSTVLKDSFIVSSPDHLKTYHLSGEDAIVFSGCAAHLCPDFFSVLLYVPSVHQAYTATCRNKRTDYSFQVTPETSSYKDALNELLRGTTGHEQSCAPDIQGGG